MQVYKCGKCERTVQATQIANIAMRDDVAVITFTDGSSTEMTQEVLNSFVPHIGGWFVLHKNGQRSICPDKFFKTRYVADSE